MGCDCNIPIFLTQLELFYLLPGRLVEALTPICFRSHSAIQFSSRVTSTALPRGA